MRQRQLLQVHDKAEHLGLTGGRITNEEDVQVACKKFKIFFKTL